MMTLLTTCAKLVGLSIICPLPMGLTMEGLSKIVNVRTIGGGIIYRGNKHVEDDELTLFENIYGSYCNVALVNDGTSNWFSYNSNDNDCFSSGNCS